MRTITLLFLSCIFAQSALAQDPVAEPGATEVRSAGSLTPRQIRAYREGRGMGAGRIADANGYPGPMHVLQLADALELSDEQRAATAQLMTEMKTRARQLGEQLITREQALEQHFADGSINSENLPAMLMEISELQAQIRLAHLQTHIDQRALLNEAQIARYGELRREARASGTTGQPMGRQQGQHRQMRQGNSSPPSQ